MVIVCVYIIYQRVCARANASNGCAKKRRNTGEHTQVGSLVYNANFPSYPLCKFTRVCYRESRAFDFCVHSLRWFSLLSFPLTSLFLSFYRAWAFNVPGDPNRRRTKPLRRKYSEYRTFHERRTTGSGSRFNNRERHFVSRVPQSKINYTHARAIRNDSTLTSDELLAASMWSVNDISRGLSFTITSLKRDFLGLVIYLIFGSLLKHVLSFMYLKFY